MSVTVFVDYADGAQGETLAYFLNSHKEFGNHKFSDQNIQELTGLETKWFNTHSLIYKDWDENFLQYLNDWKSQSSRVKVLSYHLYKYPGHIEFLKNHIPDVRFIKINSDNYEDFYKYDYIRKILFRKLTKQNINEIKFLIPDTHKVTIIQLLKQDQLRGIDVALANLAQPITTQTRQQLVKNFLSQRMIPPSQDIEVDYHDWFLDSKSLPMAYEKLCNQLKICPDPLKLDKLLKRNEKNLTELNVFVKNFDQLLETL
jgi:hypothetical protein